MADLRRKWSIIPKAAPVPNKAAIFHNQPSRSPRGGFVFHARRSFLNSSGVLMRFDHVASNVIVTCGTRLAPSPDWAHCSLQRFQKTIVNTASLVSVTDGVSWKRIRTFAVVVAGPGTFHR